jgi:AmiR/NasT family two-component response regulator
MVSRSTIEQAKGIIMSAMGCDPDEAMQVIIRQSQEQNIKVRDLAAELVRNAQRRNP